MAVSSRTCQAVDRWSKVGELGMEVALREIGCPEQRIKKALEKNNYPHFDLGDFECKRNVCEAPTRRMSEGVDLCEEGDVVSNDWEPDRYTELERSAILATVGRGSSRVQVLDLGDLTWNEAEAVCVNLTSNTKITSLTVVGPHSPFSWSAGCTLLGSAIETNPAIKELCLRHVGVGSEGVSCLMQGLQLSKSLQKLDLSGNPLGDDGVRVVAEFLGNAFSANSTLQILWLVNVGMAIEGLKCLLKWLPLNETLEELDLFLNPLGDEGVSLVAEFLATNTNIKVLNLKGVGCCLKGARHLSSALARNTSLEELRFGPFYEFTEIGVDSRYTEASSREDHTSLGADLVDCFRVILGAISLGVEDSPLSVDDPKNSSLRKLYLCLPDILEDEDPTYLEPLTLMVKGNQTLTTLGLRGLKLPLEIWKDRFFPALKENATLEVLDLRQCEGLLGDVSEAIMDLLQNSNTALRKIELGETELEDKQSHVDEELRINKEYRVSLRRGQPMVSTTSGRLVLCGFGFGGKTEICKAMRRIDRDTGPHLLEMGWKKWMQTFPVLRRLLFGKDAYRELSSRTRGCDMSILENQLPLKSIWDFAGQKEYYALHDYLFPDMNNSCFLFVCSCRDLPDDQSPRGKIKDLQRMREECEYWMQFVASNSKLSIGGDGQGRQLPCVVFVLTKKDTLNSLELGFARERAQHVVNDLRSVFKDVVELCETAKVVDARSAKDVKELVMVVKDILGNTLKRQKEYAVCQEVREVLVRWSAENPSKPVLNLDEYYKLCEEVQFTKGQPVSDEDWKLVLACLNDLGEIIFLKGLGFIVTNPRWFGLGVLGSLINAFKFKGSEVSTGLLGYRPSVLGSLEHDNGYVTRESMENLLKHSLEAMHLEQPLTIDQPIDLMLELEMCYKQDPEDADSKLFMPALFDDLTDSAAQGRRQLIWKLNERGPFVYLGRRLVCKDKDTMILTPGFFPRWQVHLLNFICGKGWASNRAFKIGRNLIGFAENGVEVFIEYSGDIDYFVDILVRSTKPFTEALQFIDDHVVQSLRRFCALRQGCQGVDLVEAVIRPVCVRELDLCVDRKAQSVLISTLKDKFALDKRWKYMWPKGLKYETDTSFAIDLLEGEGSFSSLGTTQPGSPSSSASRSKPRDDLPKLVYPSIEDVGMLRNIVTRLNLRKETAFKVHLLCDNRDGSHKVTNQLGRTYILNWKDGGFDLPIAKYLVTFAYAAAGAGTTFAGAPCVLPPIDNLVKKCFDVPGMPIDVEELQRLMKVPATTSKEDILKVLTEYMEIDPHALGLKQFLKPDDFDQFWKDFRLHKVVYTEGPHQDQVFWVCGPCYEAGFHQNILEHVPQ